jgi:hypothetical protein
MFFGFLKAKHFVPLVRIFSITNFLFFLFRKSAQPRGAVVGDGPLAIISLFTP